MQKNLSDDFLIKRIMIDNNAYIFCYFYHCSQLRNIPYTKDRSGIVVLAIYSLDIFIQSVLNI